MSDLGGQIFLIRNLPFFPSLLGFVLRQAFCKADGPVELQAYFYTQISEEEKFSVFYAVFEECL